MISLLLRRLFYTFSSLSSVRCGDTFFFLICNRLMNYHATYDYTTPLITKLEKICRLFYYLLTPARALNYPCDKLVPQSAQLAAEASVGPQRHLYHQALCLAICSVRPTTAIVDAKWKSKNTEVLPVLTIYLSVSICSVPPDCETSLPLTD